MSLASSVILPVHQPGDFEMSPLLPPTPRDESGAPLRVEPDWLQGLEAAGPDAVMSWWQALPRTPITSAPRMVKGVAMCEVTFVAHRRDDVDLLVQINGLTDHHRRGARPAVMRRIPGTPLRVLSYLLSADGCYGYRLTGTDPRVGALDPRNPAILRDGLRLGSSVWTGPAAPLVAGWPSVRPPGLGSYAQLVLPAEGGQQRRLWLHRERAASRAMPPWLLVLFDGAVWRELGIVEALRANPLALPAGTLPDLLLIDSIGPGERARDLPDRERVTAIVADALTAAAGRWGRHLRERVVLAGQSFGGLAAANVVAHRPDLARTAIVQSGSFWWTPESPRPGQREQPGRAGQFESSLARAAGLPGSRWVIQAGTDEGSMAPDALRVSRQLRELGAGVGFQHWRGGHDRAWWRHGLIAALAHCG